MSGTRLGRGRGGRLAVYGGCGLVVVLLVFLYRAATLEMARLRELHVQCVHQQEALAAQLQVIFEYKVRLEKSLAEEKSSNAAVKQELQQRASREKSLRDKDSVEAMQRFNSLQQTYKLLQTEHQDLQDECKKREKQALEDTNRLETTLQDLRSRIRQAQEDKEKSLEHLKNKYMEIENEKAKLEEKYKDMLINNGNTGSAIEHLKKEVFQLKRELEDAKKGQRPTSPAASLVSSSSWPAGDQQRGRDSMQHRAIEQPVQQPSSLQQQQHTSSTSSMKAIPVMRLESSTRSNSANSASTTSDRALAPARPVSKFKLPVGVVPIPILMDQKLDNTDNRQREEAKKKEEPPQHAQARNNPVHVDSKDNEQVERGDNLDPQFPPLQGARHGDRGLNRRGNGALFGVRPGVQEIGDELNHLGRLPGFDEGAGLQVEADDQYEGADYDKEPQQKNDMQLAEGEDEGEDEDDQ